MSLARTLSSVAAAAISTAVYGGDSVHAAAITFRCTNPKGTKSPGTTHCTAATTTLTVPPAR